MTVINRSELTRLGSLDQAIMWAVMSINASNIDPRNTFISDSAAIRAESANYVQWSVTQDDTGMGKFVYTALLPLVNPNPLKNKASLVERVWSYSPYNPSMFVDVDSGGYGYGIPPLHLWLDTTERLLTYLSIFGSLISKYARMTQQSDDFWATIHPEYWAECDYKITDSAYGGTVTITGILSIDWTSYIEGKSLLDCLDPYSGHASNVSCNFPLLDLLWDVPTVDLTQPPAVLLPMVPMLGAVWVDPNLANVIGVSTAAGLINSYSNNNLIDDSLPDWYINAINNPQSAGDLAPNATGSVGWTTPPIVESLPVCKEQDPNMISYANQLADKPPVK